MNELLLGAVGNPRLAVLSLIKSRVEVPAPLVLSELWLALQSLFSSSLHDEPISDGLLAYIGALAYRAPTDPVAAAPVGDLCQRARLTPHDSHIRRVLHEGLSLFGAGAAAVWVDTPAINVRARWSASEPPGLGGHPASTVALCATLEATLGPIAHDIQLHGSLSDRTMTAYSDYDLLVILRAEALADDTRFADARRRVVQAHRHIMQLDPLQHHGLFLVPLALLDYYQQHFFPLPLMDTATSIAGAPRLTSRPIENTVAKAHAVVAMCSRILGVKTIPEDAFQLKLLTSWVMLLPVLVHQLFGRYVYKPHAYEPVKATLAPEAVQAIDAATELRQRWQPETGPRLLREIDPDFCAHAHALARQVREQVYAASLDDPHWAAVDPARKHAHVACTDHPAHYDAAEFQRVVERRARACGRVPGVHSVYALGKLVPTPGISDIDLLVVADTGADRDQAIRAIVTTLDEQRDQLKGLDRYLQWHGEVVMHRDEVATLFPIWTPAPRFMVGQADLAIGLRPPSQDELAASRTLLLFKEGYFQLRKLFGLLYEPQLPLRLVLLRAHSVIYDLTIAEELFGVRPPLAAGFANACRGLREQWFTLPDPDRIIRATDVLKVSIRLLHHVLASVADALVRQGVVREPAVPTGHFSHQDGRVKVEFDAAPFAVDAPTNLVPATGTIRLPLAALPVIHACLPVQAILPAPDPADMHSCLDARYRELAHRYRGAVQSQLSARQ